MTAPALAVDNRRGALLLCAAAAVFTAEAMAVKAAAEVASNGQIVFARAFVQLLVVGAIIALRDPGLVRTSRPGMHLARGLTSLVCWWLYYRSFQALPIALATTLTFATSLFTVALAPLVLRERVGPRRWAATVAGFGGVALASGAVSATLAPGVVWGLGAAAAGAVLVFLNRMLSRTAATLTIMFWIAVVCTLGTAPVLWFDWRPLDPATVALVALSGTLGTLGMFLTVEAYRVGEVSALAPFPYLRIVFAMAAGAFVLAEPPAPTTLAGAAIIVACALAAGRGEAPAPSPAGRG